MDMHIQDLKGSHQAEKDRLLKRIAAMEAASAEYTRNRDDPVPYRYAGIFDDPLPASDSEGNLSTVRIGGTGSGVEEAEDTTTTAPSTTSVARPPVATAPVDSVATRIEGTGSVAEVSSSALGELGTSLLLLHCLLM